MGHNITNEPYEQAEYSSAKSRNGGHVYFLVMQDPQNPQHDFGLVKIGITRGDVLQRAAMLQTGNPYDLLRYNSVETLWPREVEHFLHRTHAAQMQKPEWLQCARDQLPALVDEAREVVRRIEARKLAELSCLGRSSNGRSRRASLREFNLHREVRKVMKELVPQKLRLKTAQDSLKAATGTTFGIPGVVRVETLPPLRRFNEKIAATEFSNLVSRCLVEKISGSFRWRKVPRPIDFPAEYRAAKVAAMSAEVAESAVIQKGILLAGQTARTCEIEATHEDYLHAIRNVNRLEGDLADLRTEIIVLLDDCDALDGVCSFARRPMVKLDSSEFQRRFPGEYSQCEMLLPGRLGKYVYFVRPYLAG